MKASLIILLSMATLGCAKQTMDTQTTEQPAATMGTTPPTGNYHYLALGDSYTIGQSVDQAGSFPYQLKSKLVQSGYNVQNPDIVAVTGWTTADLQYGITQATLANKYDFVTLLIGVNNQYRGYSQTEYRAQFVQLLNTALAFAGYNKQRVIVLSIPDWGVTPYAAGGDRAKIATEIDQFNAINKDESTKAGVGYLDITPISRQAATDGTLIATDGLHPSAKMYGLWVAQLAPLVVATLK